MEGTAIPVPHHVGNHSLNHWRDIHNNTMSFADCVKVSTHKRSGPQVYTLYLTIEAIDVSLDGC